MRRVRRRLTLLAVLAAAAAFQPPQAAADATLATLDRPAPLSAHAGHVVWSSSLGSGEIQAQELIGPTVDAGQVTWARVLFGDTTENGLRRYSIYDGVRERATVPPPGSSPFLRPVLAYATNGGSHLYLVSGPRAAEPGCTVAQPCVSDPGCTDAAPCELRIDAGVAFTRYGRPRRSIPA